MGKKEERASFNGQVAPQIAEALGLKGAASSKPSSMFALYEDEQRVLLVAGAQEEKAVEKALARGLAARGSKALLLALPEDHCFATQQRAPWLTPPSRPELYLHDGQSLLSSSPVRHKSRDQTVEALSERLKEGQSLEQEFVEATTPPHLGDQTSAVSGLVEWATTDPRLDPGHRKGVRAWHCMGQRVLTIKRTNNGIAIRAGIHYTGDNAPAPLEIAHGGSISERQVSHVRDQVEDAIAERLEGGFNKADEHWLQAVIRRDPSLVGVEQPALREVPAWRPRDTPTQWGRGFIDIVGLDGHGDIRIVETKLTKNDDELLVLQGLDYFVWSRSYRSVIASRLGAPLQARLEVHYVIGDDLDGQIKVSGKTAPQAASLHRDVRSRFQTIHNWFGHLPLAGRPSSKLFPPSEVPG